MTMTATGPSGLREACLVAIAWLCLLGFSGAVHAENEIEIRETFFRLSLNEETQSYERTEVDTARPGDLIELRIEATNTGGRVALDLELINTVPRGRAELIVDSFQFDESNGEYRLSPNDERFFPPSADIPADRIHYVQWLIYELAPGQTETLSYRLRIPQ